ncbi:MAG: hypothetical protein K5656_11965 [Lachnospiraceae bacterium]|nr:hypothetical protein [Lachnospiraceae bacterium]
MKKLTRVIAMFIMISLLFNETLANAGSVSFVSLNDKTRPTYSKYAYGADVTEHITTENAITESDSKASGSDSSITTETESTGEIKTTESQATESQTTENYQTTETSPSNASEDASADASMDAIILPIKNNQFSYIKVDTTDFKYIYNSYFNVSQLEVNGYTVSSDGTKTFKLLSTDSLSCVMKDGSDLAKITQSCGYKVIVISYKDVSTVLSTEFTIFVKPDNVADFKEIKATTSSITVSWTETGGADGYQLCYYNEEYDKWYYYGGPTSNKIPAGKTSYTIKTKTEASGDATITPVVISAGESYQFYVRAFYIYAKDENGKNKVSYTPMSVPFTLKTTAGKTSGMAVVSQNASQLTIRWDEAKGTDGYIIYRKSKNDEKFSYYTTIHTNSFTDGLASPLIEGSTYKYRVANYVLNTDIHDEFSDTFKATTTPVKTTAQAKGGDLRMKVSWLRSPGAVGYNVYMKATASADFSYIGSSLQGTYFFIQRDLEMDEVYSFKVIAYRTINVGAENEYTVYSEESNVCSGSPKEVADTNVTAFNYLSLADFKGSVAYESSAWFRKYINYKRSSIIPGASAANVGGFFSDRMCPQGMTFAGDYMLITAYDKNSEERSVIYVMEKGDGDYLTTIVLPDMIHAGGIAYDGHNVWVCHGDKMACIRYLEIKEAVEEGDIYREVSYICLIPIDCTASYCTYYKNQLWVGSFSITDKQPVYCYTVSDKTNTPTIKSTSSFEVPERTQGMAFTTDGSLVLSRSYGADSTKDTYICQLDYYSPTWKDNKVSKIGSSKNSISMPSMNETIAIKGAYIYVCYESPAFSNATVPMDRVCAFKKSGLLDKKTR